LQIKEKLTGGQPFSLLAARWDEIEAYLPYRL
jgi:hypothetical protein